MSDDLIKRSDAIETAYQLRRKPNDDEWDWWLRSFNAIPSADRPQGEWKRRIVDNGFNADWVCSECGYRVKTDFVDYNFCPSCGARMKGADDD